MNKPILVIKLPPGCTIKRNGDTVEVYKIERRIPEGEYRCKDCFWRQLGYATQKRRQKSMICKQKPKGKPYYGHTPYSHAAPYDNICDKFQLL